MSERDTYDGIEALWRDKDLLVEEYVEKDRTAKELASEWGCSEPTINRWGRKHGLRKKREWGSAVPFKTHKGYEVWKHNNNNVSVHQLLAIAEGEDPAKVFSNGDYQIHHKNGVPWDNRPENIELMTEAEHMEVHGRTAGITEELVEELHVEQEMAPKEVAAEIGCPVGTVRDKLKEYNLRWDLRWKRD